MKGGEWREDSRVDSGGWGVESGECIVGVESGV